MKTILHRFAYEVSSWLFIGWVVLSCVAIALWDALILGDAGTDDGAE
jgi:hypothetical protein